MEKIEVTEEKLFECEHCKHKTKRKGDLKQHLANIHNIDVVWYKCRN